LSPPCLSGFFGNLRTTFGSKLGGPRFAAFNATLASKFQGGIVLSPFRRLILDLTGQDVAQQLAELYGVAGALSVVGHQSASVSGRFFSL
jgi:hypothetical protein